MSDIETRALALRSVGYADRIIEACATLLRAIERGWIPWPQCDLAHGLRLALDEAQRDRAAALALLAGAGDKEQGNV